MNSTLLSEPPFEAKPISGVKTIMVLSQDEVIRRFLSDVIREASDYRVLEATGATEGRYLTAVEGKINLLVADALSKENFKFAQWFLSVHPESTVLVADDSLWELTSGREGCDQVLMAKSYTLNELVSCVNRLLADREYCER